ncbi:hypothetical protein M436DRAFT_60731 [Aureobasidium namibiae CBS 147.97]|uniref:Uncharacterized protein n=1 Tax=Aureobasidium namibiae CBS 147.97 TaxID=1043004 RepID=A0A074WZL4_9PEZI|nr:uncharacterized protein M436DRAFT_60731 [Aureobasidium namibiae CBS 147.97]KEQ76934.1 hypothetical protein M436DRAFT_60731 [Aureobasidium namibiae CBS 147.97]
MLLQYYIPALLLAHAAAASSYRDRLAGPYNHVLRSGREYPSQQIEVSALSGQTSNVSAMVTGQGNNNNNTASTLDQTNHNATNDTARLDSRARRLAELDAAGIEFSTYLYWENPEACPSREPECKDCGGEMLLWHRDELVPSSRCSGLKDEGMKWKDCRCTNSWPEEFVTPCMPSTDSVLHLINLRRCVEKSSYILSSDIGVFMFSAQKEEKSMKAVRRSC